MEQTMLIAVLIAVLVGLFLFDTVRLRRMQAQRDAAKEEVAEVKTEFLSRISHEIKTPMNVIVGATEDTAGKLSYSGIQYERGIRYRFMDPGETEPADTMNANCVLIPYALFRRTGSMDRHYHHSLGDFDYGFALREAGGTLRVSQGYVGLCCDNPQTGTWHDRSLPLKQRLKKKESVKGDPIGPWFYYLKKHFGLFTAIKSSLTPYIRIFLGL